MKVLITGKGSYVGTHIKQWLEKTEGFIVDELDMLDSRWSEYDFSSYDIVIHVAAIVHRKKEKISWDSYHKINTMLVAQTANKARKSGVKHFVFFSTMAVYGQKKQLPHGNIIDENTRLRPNNFYGKSKLEAELLLQKMSSSKFVISIVRPPNIYGPKCPGNYLDTFKKITKISPVFPKVFEDCKQSFIYIDNLCEYIRLLVLDTKPGVFCPQDEIRISTYEIVLEIARALHKKIYFSTVFGKVIKSLAIFPIIRKLYGGISYSDSLSKYTFTDYNMVNFENAIKKTVASDGKKGERNHENISSIL